MCQGERSEGWNVCSDSGEKREKTKERLGGEKIQKRGRKCAIIRESEGTERK